MHSSALQICTWAYSRPAAMRNSSKTGVSIEVARIPSRRVFQCLPQIVPHSSVIIGPRLVHGADGAPLPDEFPSLPVRSLRLQAYEYLLFGRARWPKSGSPRWPLRRLKPPGSRLNETESNPSPRCRGGPRWRMPSNDRPVRLSRSPCAGRGYQSAVAARRRCARPTITVSTRCQLLPTL